MRHNNEATIVKANITQVTVVSTEGHVEGRLMKQPNWHHRHRDQ